ncbi:MAG: hypothetical protein AB7U85_08345 [Alphaproteobacteria bacterium]
MEQQNNNNDFDLFTLNELLEELNSVEQKKEPAKQPSKSSGLDSIVDFYRNQLENPSKETAVKTEKKQEGGEKVAEFLNKEGLSVVESGTNQKKPERKGPFFKLADYVDKQSVSYALKNAAIVGGAVAVGKAATEYALTAGVAASTAAYITPGVMLTVGAVRGVLDLRKELKEKKNNKILSDLAKLEISNRKFPNVKEIEAISALRKQASERGLDKVIAEKLEPFLAKGLDESKLPTEFVDKQGAFKPWVKFASRVALQGAVIGASAIAGPVAGMAIGGAALLYKSGALDKVYKLITGKETKRAEEKRLALEKLSPEERAAKKKKLIGNTILALGTTTAASILGGNLGKQFGVSEFISDKATEMGNALGINETVESTKETFNNMNDKIFGTAHDHSGLNTPADGSLDHNNIIDAGRNAKDLADNVIGSDGHSAGGVLPVSGGHGGNGGADVDTGANTGGGHDIIAAAQIPGGYDSYSDISDKITDYLGDEYFNHSTHSSFVMTHNGVEVVKLDNFNPNNPNDVIDLMINDRSTFNRIVENQKEMNDMISSFREPQPTLEDVAGEALAKEASVLHQANPGLTPDEALNAAVKHRINMHTTDNAVTSEYDFAKGTVKTSYGNAYNHTGAAAVDHSAAVDHTAQADAVRTAPVENHSQTSGTSVKDVNQAVRDTNRSVSDVSKEATQMGRDIGARVRNAQSINNDWGISDKGGEVLGDARDAAYKAARTGRAMTETSGGVDRMTAGVEKIQDGNVTDGAQKVAQGVEQTARGVDKAIRTVSGHRTGGLSDVIDNAAKSSRTINSLKRIFGSSR